MNNVLKDYTKSGAVTQHDIDQLLEFSNENQFGRNESYYKLQEYEDLQENKRIAILPYRLNTVLYVLFKKGVFPMTVVGYEVYESENDLLMYGAVPYDFADNYYYDYLTVSEQELNKRVFENKEKADKAYSNALATGMNLSWND